jgi:3-phenylpropionate/cinnamic acid dioxygenase small subunit
MATYTEDQTERACRKFLYHEAELLDNVKFHDWLDVLDPAIDYRVPVRTTRENKDGDGFSKTAFFMDEDFGSLKMRIARLNSDYAWSENPRTRTRRMVANIRVGSMTENGAQTRVEVASNLAVFCHRGDVAAPQILTCERKDVLVRQDGQWKLASRLALLDATVLGLESLSIFL